MPPPRAAIAALAARQDSVITTAQCTELGADRSWVARRVRSGIWQRLHPGVIVVHSGPLTWRTRAQAALLHAGPGSALSHAAAGYVHEFTTRPPRIIDVTIPHRRRVRPTTGVRIHRRRDLPVLPGRLRTLSRPETVLDLLEAAASDDEAIGILCAAVRAHTWPEEVLDAAVRRKRLRQRPLVLEMLGAVSAGIESPLEMRYHRDVERRHGLPRARLQTRQVLDGIWIRADRIYEGLGVRTELDGELAHPGGRTDADVWRDNVVVITTDEITLRYRWSHVRGTPCRTAAQVAAALRSRGWRGTPRACSPDCPVR